MAWQKVTVIHREGDKPRDLCFDDSPNADGSEGRGASMIETLKRQVRREELHSVTVTPVDPEAPPPERKVAAKKAAAKRLEETPAA